MDREEDQDKDYTNGHTDVIVEFQNGETYVASFFTYKNLESIRVQNRISGDFLGGKYFWVESMVFIDECSLGDVRVVINNMLEEGDFENIFRKL